MFFKKNKFFLTPSSLFLNNFVFFNKVFKQKRRNCKNQEKIQKIEKIRKIRKIRGGKKECRRDTNNLDLKKRTRKSFQKKNLSKKKTEKGHRELFQNKKGETRIFFFKRRVAKIYKLVFKKKRKDTKRFKKKLVFKTEKKRYQKVVQKKQVLTRLLKKSRF